jgi:hypothetical protein
MTRLGLVMCAVLLLASCAPVQDHSFESNAIRSEILAGHAAERTEVQPEPAAAREPYWGPEYQRQRLSIEPIGMSAGFWGGGWFGGSATGMSWRKWLAYQGFSEISEPEFFEVTGYADEARRAQSHHNLAIAETFGGAFVSVLGLVVVAGGYGETPIDWTQADIGYVISLVGLGMVWDGSVRMDRNWAPFDLAKGIADEYNAGLRPSDPGVAP